MSYWHNHITYSVVCWWRPRETKEGASAFSIQPNCWRPTVLIWSELNWECESCWYLDDHHIVQHPAKPSCGGTLESLTLEAEQQPAGRYWLGTSSNVTTPAPAALQPRPSHQLLSLVVAGHCRGGRLELSRWFILLQRVLWIINNQHCGVYDDTLEKGLEVVILSYYWLHRQHWAMSHGGSAHARHNSSALPCHMCCAVLPCLLPGCCSSLL